MGQYCIAGWCLSSSVVCGRARGRSAAAGSDAWAVGQPTLHGGPVWLRPVRATPFSVIDWCETRQSSWKNSLYGALLEKSSWRTRCFVVSVCNGRSLRSDGRRLMISAMYLLALAQVRT